MNMTTQTIPFGSGVLYRTFRAEEPSIRLGVPEDGNPIDWSLSGAKSPAAPWPKLQIRIPTGDLSNPVLDLEASELIIVGGQNEPDKAGT